MEELAKEAEEAAQKVEQRNVYKITKFICGKYSGSRHAPIRDKQGQLLNSEKDQEARWVEHFKEVLNRPAPEVEPDIPEAEEDLSVDTGPPKKEEIIAAINYSDFRGKARVLKCKRFCRQKGGHGPRRSMRRPWKLGTRNATLLPLRDRLRCLAKNVLARIAPYAFISHRKMSIVFGKGQSTNYIA